MSEYHKIQTVFKRDPKTNHKTLLEGQYSLPEFEYLKDNNWTFTEKVDGTNIRIIFDGENITFAGRTDRAQMQRELQATLDNIFMWQKDKFKLTFPYGCIFYGEGYGAKIQKGGGNYRADQGFVLFDVKVGDFWLRRFDVEALATKFELRSVPVIGSGSLDEMIELVRNGFDSQWGKFRAEGVVARPSVELHTRSGDRIITKLKCKDFA